MEILTRGTFRTSLTKIVKAASEFLDSQCQLNEQNVNRFDEFEEELETFIERLTAIHEKLKEANKQVMAKNLIKVEDLERELDKMADYEDIAVTHLARLNNRLRKLRAKQNPFNNPPDNNTMNFSSNIVAPSHKSNIRLPKLQLKKFDGNMRDWMPFWDQFKTTVHQNEQLSAAEKFNYLEDVLSGAAKKTIAGFTATSSCYDAAVALLLEQYGDTEKLVDNHMQKLISLNQVTVKSDVVGLRNLYNSISTSIRSLTALQVPSQRYDVMLKSILLRCLPSEMRVDYHRRENDDEIEPSKEVEAAENDRKSDNNSSDTQSSLYGIHDRGVKSILRFLKKEVEALERSRFTATSTRSHAKASVTTAASLIGTKSEEHCIFCDSTTHTTKNCQSMTLQQKRERLRKDNRCFRCAKKGHMSRKCRSSNFLKCSNCGAKHLSSLCEKTKNTEEAKSKDESSYTMCVQNSVNCVFLKTARCVAFGKNTENRILRVVIDGGSQLSFIKESVANKLNLLNEYKLVQLSLIPFGCKQNGPTKSFKKIKLRIRSQYRDEIIIIEVIVVPEICADVLSAPDPGCKLFRDLNLADCVVANLEVEDEISLLIGADHYWSIVTGKQRCLSNSLRAVDTVFGWTLQGIHPNNMNAKGTNIIQPLIVCNACNTSLQDFSALWALESIGILGEEPERQRLTEEMTNKYIKRVGCRYQASLPWKEPSVVFDSNKDIAVSRLNSLYRRLSRDPKKLQEYNDSIQQMVVDGIAQRVGPSSSTRRTIYLPHRPVYKEDSTTTKMRIVFDASSQAEGCPSLNDQLLTGTNLLPDVLKTLLNFRLGKVGLVADIEKAFLQILLSESDQDAHRFIWFKSPLNPSSPHQEYRMTRVTFGVCSSPFLLTATIRHHLREEKTRYPRTCQILDNSFYMDDLVMSVNSEVEGERVWREATTIMSRAGMCLRKWHSSSPTIRRAITADDLPAQQKVLGLIWMVYSDELSVSLQPVQSFIELNSSRGTKRIILSTLARIYDPLGIIIPTVIKLKILFQVTWKRKINWDETLPGDLLTELEECNSNILQLKDMAIARSVLQLTSSECVQCHIFADASLRAYGAVAYIRVVDKEGRISVSFLCSKSRVAPMKMDGSNELTLPKLELTAALIASRLCEYLKKSLKICIKEYFLWSDSKITLNWIYGQLQKWKPYVQSRVEEIRRHTSVADWGHCPGHENPADLITRGISGDKLQSSKIWINGPSWLNVPVLKDRTDIADIENQVSLLMQVTQDASVKQQKVPMEPIVSCENFSTWLKLLRVTSWVLRFVHRKQCSEKFLTKEEIDDAELYWLRYVQRIVFSNEYFSLKRTGVLESSSKILKLGPYLDDKNLIRVGGRLQMLEENDYLKHPIILPFAHHITELIIDAYHQTTLHGGVNIVLAKMRERFWLIKGRLAIKKRIKSCVICRKSFGKPATQPFAPLPIHRITMHRPFDNVGLDFAGPLYYQGDDGSTMRKCYLLLFTCAAVRAVHVELTTTMSTECCVMALKRFIARRGTPSVIFSDNAKSFRRAAFELKGFQDAMQGGDIPDFLSKNRIKWNFIIERAPWWGGFWERMIRTIKNILKTVIGKAKLSFDQLRTLLTETEALVNERPLTYISEDPSGPSPLTPAKFLQMGCKITSTNQSNELDSSGLRELWKHRNKYFAKMTIRWRIEYMQQLRSFHLSNPKTSTQLKPGDVALLYDSAKPRVHWEMVMVHQTFAGRDGKVRACEVRFPDRRLMKRPIQLLYPLELANSAGAAGC